MIAVFIPGLVCIILAAFFKAVSDTLAHHLDTSAFRRKWDSPFWNPLHRHNDAVKKVFGFPCDAWHISNSIMITSFIVATLFQTPLVWYWQVLIYGVVFNLTFNLFYNKILR